jgi:hypothetical protein
MSAPVVTALSPSSGLATGGTAVAITGTGLTGATAVNFGAVAAVTFTVWSDTQLVVSAPAGTGQVNVTVTTPGGTSATAVANQFYYAAFTAKYSTLAALKEYGRIQASNIVDDDSLAYQLVRADCAIDHHCGTDFAYLSNVAEQARKCWVDRNGWLQVQTHKPIYDPTTISVSVMDVRHGATAWTALTLTQCLCMAPVNDGDAPRAQAWQFAAYPANVSLVPEAWGDIYVQTSYQSGYPTIPPQLTAVATRLAWFYYKLREAPMMKIDTLNLGTVEIPVEMPQDVRSELNTWRRPL